MKANGTSDAKHVIAALDAWSPRKDPCPLCKRSFLECEHSIVDVRAAVVANLADHVRRKA